MQSWGTRSRFDERDTGLEPSKSGVLGLVCAALGRGRSEAVDDLAALRMGVRIDREGVLRYDYQTAQRVLTANVILDRPPEKRPAADFEDATSRRYYIADAVFLAGLEGSDTRLLASIHEALQSPRWPLYLGRKSYVPSQPVWLQDGLKDFSLEETLRGYPSLLEPTKGPPRNIRYVLENPEQGAQRMDQLLAPFSERRFGVRYVRTEVW
jgi:CRISPR system Cascade subunit CasD